MIIDPSCPETALLREFLRMQNIMLPYEVPNDEVSFERLEEFKPHLSSHKEIHLNPIGGKFKRAENRFHHLPSAGRRCHEVLIACLNSYVHAPYLSSTT
jgi:hypothetical protein